MTDEQIAEIYSLARESFFGGQKSFQIQAYPFRMTPTNMAKHRNSPHMAFWKMLKQGYDHFEVTRQEPKVDVCEKRYVFDAEASGKFSAAERCPAYKVPAELVAAVRDKQRREDIQVAELINRGIPAAPVRTGTDGGMNPTFLAAVKSHGGPGANIRTSVGTIPAHVNPPGEPVPETTTGSFMSLASSESKPAAAPRSSVQVASAAPAGSSGGIGGFFGNLFGSKEKEQAAEPRAGAAAETAKPKPAARPPQVAAAGAIRPKQSDTPQAEPKAAARASKPQPAQDTQQQASAEPPAKPANSSSLLNGAAPTVPSGGFENRFGAWR
jgi:hypothetical protein